MTPTTVPFSKLVSSDEINARPTTKDGLDELAASIEVKGLIQPLAVRPADGNSSRFEIIDGRRRYLAMARLVKDKVWARDTAVPVLVRNEDDREALETSLMANTVRLPMHPVDQHEVFARLAEQGHGAVAEGGQPKRPGMTPADIAARFGIAERTVRQHLALGRLAPEVRQAWRKGKIDAETAQAFAIHPDAAVQADVLKRLGARCEAWTVRNELADSRERVDQSDEMAIVGEAAYLAAGGTIDDDLFEDARYVADVPLLKKLARDLLEAECDRLRADGWAWALIEDEAKFEGWACDHVRGDDADEDLAPDAFTADEKARSGCLVSIDATWPKKQATIGVKAGLIAPAGRAATGGDQTDLDDFTDADDDAGEPGALPSTSAMIGGDDPKPSGPFEISGALFQDLTAAQTVAAAKVLARDRDLALRVAIAALATGRSYESPAKLVMEHTAHDRPNDSGDFSAVLARHAGEVLPVLADRLAGIVAQSLQLSSPNDFEGRRALVDAIDPDDYLAAMREAFPAADYFKRASKATAIEALEQMHEQGHHFGLLGRADLEGMKKAELAAWATEQAKACGWLPPEIRNTGYGLILAKPKRLTGKMAAAEQTSRADDGSEVVAPKRTKARARA